MRPQRWAAEHSAIGAPIGIVLYDGEDGSFVVKTADDEWTVYRPVRHETLSNAVIDRCRGDQILGIAEL